MRKPQTGACGDGMLRGACKPIALVLILLGVMQFAPDSASAEVTQRGTYTQAISVQVPPFHSITPEIRLTYDSSLRNGPLGLGWSLQADSQITRTGQPVGVPRYNSVDDRFWLDGMDLVECDSQHPLGASCVTGGTHRTREESYQRIKQDLQNNTWTVTQKSGVQFVYTAQEGDTTFVDGTLRWLLSTITDTHGNVVSYHHECDASTNACYLTSISYGDGKVCKSDKSDGHDHPKPLSSKLPGVQIHFIWESRSDFPSAAIGFGVETTALRLRAIDVSDDNGRVRVYQLTYAPGPTSWIQTIQTFGSDAILSSTGTVVLGTALPARRFDAPAASLQQSASSLSTVSGNHQFVLPEQANSSLPPTYSFRSVPVLPASQVAIPTYNPAAPYAEMVESTRSALVGDFDGDKKLDFLTWSMNSQCTQIMTRTLMAAESPTSAPNTSPAISIDPADQANACITTAFAADLDGDGRTDIVFLRYRRTNPFDATNLNYEADVITALSNGDGSFSYTYDQHPKVLWATHNQKSAEDNEANILASRCTVADVNGDGRQDLVCTVKDENGNWVVVEAIAAEGGQVDLKQDLQIANLTDNHILATGDVNGDGLADLIVIDALGSSNAQTIGVRIGVSLGTGLFSWTTQATGLDFIRTDREYARIQTGDFNADGRTDFALEVSKADDSGGSYTTFSSQGGASPQYLVNRTIVTGSMPIMSVGDFDGDGLDDLVFAVHNQPLACGSTQTVDNVSRAYSFSDGSGIFDIPTRFDACYAPTLMPWSADPYFQAHAANVNGDRIADLFEFFPAYVTGPSGTVESYSLVDVPGEYVADDAQNWRTADLNGDGVPDWLYLRFANPGLTVLTQIARPDGTHSLVREDIALPAATAHADLASTWFLGDVGGGPGGAPDGKADIVIPDDTSQNLIALVSNGDGHWTKTVTPYSSLANFDPDQLHSMLRGVESSSNADVNGWRLLDVNGDGRSDLVHITYKDPGGTFAPYLLVMTLLSNGDGTWTLTSPQTYDFQGALRTANIRNFIPMDVNGDGRMDLVQLERESTLFPDNNARPFVLISKGDGTYEDVAVGVSLPNDAIRSWLPMEINGDSSTDLVYFSTQNGQLNISAMISLGNGNWQSMAPTAVAPNPIIDTASITDLRIADLDGDGKQDVVYFNSRSSTQRAAMVIWNRYPNFIQTTTDQLPLAGWDTRDWRLSDIDGDDRPELVRVPHDGSDLDVLTIPINESRMTSAGNGLGASEAITYGPLTETDRTMPLGAIPHVVKSVADSSTSNQPSYDALFNYNYAQATYSYGRHLFLGFGHIESSDATRTIAADFTRTDACGAQLQSDALLDDQRRMIARSRYFPTTTTYSDALCRVDQVDHEEWEGAASPRVRHDVYSYDDFGNVTELKQQTDGPNGPMDVRKLAAQFIPNVADFIVDRVSYQEIDQATQSHSGWNQLSKTQYDYDNSTNYLDGPGSVGDLTRTERWNDQTSQFVDTAYAYDARGNLHLITGPPIPSNPAGVTVTINCDCDYQRFLEQICDPLYCAQFDWDKRLGQVHSSTDPNNQKTVFDHDALGRQTGVTRPDQSFEHWIWPTSAQWDTPQQGVRHELSDDSAGDGVLWDLTLFDGLGRATQIEREGGSSIELTYDGISERIHTRTAPHFPNATPAVTQQIYDAAGRPTFLQNPDSSVRRSQYAVGNFTTRDEIGASVQNDVDPFGRVTAIHENRRNCSGDNCPIVETGLTQYRYDALDRLTRIIDAQKNETRLSWDSLGRVLNLADPDRGLTTFQWNDDGTSASQTDANGSIVHTLYDAIARRVTEVALDPSGAKSRVIKWTWDTDPTRGGLQGDSIGHVVRVDDKSPAASLTSTYGYDVLGRSDSKTECIDTSCFDLQQRFDHAGRIHSVAYPDSSGHITQSSPTVQYQYADNGLLDSVPGYVQKLQHDAAGHTTDIAFANGIEELRPFSPRRGWNDSVGVTRRTSGFPRRQSVLFDQILSHDPAGRIHVQDIWNSRGSYEDVFEHDDLGRLTNITSTNAARDIGLSYDIIGDLSFQSRLGNVEYKDPKHVHAITDTQSGEHFDYDLAGQMKRSNTLRFTWTDTQQPERIVGSTVSTFVYNSERRRVKADLGGQTTLTPDPLIEVDASGKIKPWIFAEGRRVARLGPGGANYLHTDTLGSTRLITNSAGNILSEYDYAPWGTDTAIANAGPTQIRFAAGDADATTALIHMGERYYDPQLGHFISADPVIPNLYKPQTLNHYTYAFNDPVTLADPTGLNPESDDESIDSPTEPSRDAKFHEDEMDVYLYEPPRPTFGPIPTEADTTRLFPFDSPLAQPWLLRGPLVGPPAPPYEQPGHQGFQLESQVEIVAQTMKHWIDERWISGDALAGVGLVKQLQTGASFSVAAGILTGRSGTDVPFQDSPDRYSDVYDFYVEPTLASYLMTWTWYDPDPSVGMHLIYTDPAKAIQLGLAVGFSPGNLPGIGDLPNNTPNNANFPHAAGDFGSIADFAASKFLHYNEQIDAGSWLGARFYVHW